MDFVISSVKLNYSTKKEDKRKATISNYLASDLVIKVLFLVFPWWSR